MNNWNNWNNWKNPENQIPVLKLAICPRGLQRGNRRTKRRVIGRRFEPYIRAGCVGETGERRTESSVAGLTATFAPGVRVKLANDTPVARFNQANQTAGETGDWKRSHVIGRRGGM